MFKGKSGGSVTNLDHYASWSRALEGEGATKHANASDHLHSSQREASVLGLDFGCAGEIEADMKPAWIVLQFVRAKFAEHECKTRIVVHQGEARALGAASQTKALLEECGGTRYIRNGEIKVVESHEELQQVTDISLLEP